MKSLSLPRILARLLPMAYRAAPVLFLVSAGLGIAHGLTIGLRTLVSHPFFDSVALAVEEGSGTALVLWMAVAFGVVVIGGEVLNGLHNFLFKTYMNKAIGSMGMLVNQKASRIEPITYEDPALLDDINKANEGMNHSIGVVAVCLTLITFYLPYFLFMGAYLYVLKPILVFALALIFVPVALNQIMKAFVFAKLEDEAAPLRREFESYQSSICDREYFKETRLLGAVYFFREKFLSVLHLFGEKKWKAERRTGLLELGMKGITLAGYFGVLYLLFAALLNGEISIGAFAAVFASIGSMFNIMEEIVSSHIGHMTKNLGTVRNYIRFLDLPERGGEDKPVNPGNGIVLQQVSFRYPGAEKNALTDISLEVKKGETIAIVGGNGAGKTTLVQLMTGLYLPAEGKVLIDGMDSSQVSGESVYKGISAVFQQFQRYKMTLADNVRISEVDTIAEADAARDPRLEYAVGQADLEPAMARLPQWHDTMLSREFDGIDLSGGQWQRVAIARGFYRAHDLIVLDEPTAAIDPLEETRLYQQFADMSQDKTAIIVTHRLGSARIADHIIVMEGGQLAEMGTHEELLRAGGKYAEMFHAQAQWYAAQ